MDMHQLASDIVKFLSPFAPYLGKAGEEIAKKVGADVWGRAKEIYGAIRDRLRKEKDTKAERTLMLFQEDPELFKEALTKVLLTVMQSDPQFATNLSKLASTPAVQRIVAASGASIQGVKQRQRGARGTQIVGAEGPDTRIKDVEQEID